MRGEIQYFLVLSFILSRLPSLKKGKNLMRSYIKIFDFIDEVFGEN